MTIKKISPVAEFLRANHAKAKNHNAYYTNTGDFLKSCDFFDPSGKYLGRMSRRGDKVGRNPSFAYLGSYIETVGSGFSAGLRQVKENVIHFAKVVDENGQKLSYLPETMEKKQVVIDANGLKTTDIFKRTINSKLKLLEKADPNAYGYVPQNKYQALEPVKYNEVLAEHSVVKSDKF